MRYFFKLKHVRRVATRFDKLARDFLAAVLLASTRLWLRLVSPRPRPESDRLDHGEVARHPTRYTKLVHRDSHLNIYEAGSGPSQGRQ